MTSNPVTPPLLRASYGLLLTVILCCFGTAHGWSQSSAAPLLVKVTDDKGAGVIGELKSETDDQLELIDLKTGKKLIYQKSALNDSRKGITDREAAATIGLPEFLVWKIRRVIPGGTLSGKIAQIDGSIVYVTLSAQTGLEKGQELFVYRGDQPIKHPDTGEVLGMQRRRTAKLIVTEALDKHSKTKLTGDLEVELQVGDTVEPANQSKPIAILPLVDLNGEIRAGGKKLGEDLTTGLIQGGVSVVERTLLAKVLVELGLQNTKVFDAEKMQKIGKQLGAFAILAGTLTASGYGSDVNLRLIRVETGEILFATRQNGPTPGPVVGFGQDTVIIESTTPRSAGVHVSSGNVSVMPTLPSSYQAGSNPPRCFELRTYYAAEGKLDELNNRFREHTCRLFKKHGIESLGYWLPLENPERKLIYILAYTSREAREKSWKAFLADPDWQAAYKASQKNGLLVTKMDSIFLSATDYSPAIKAAKAAAPRTFELRIYTATAGNLGALDSRFRDRTIKLFSKHGMEHIGYWYLMPEQKGAENTLIYLIAHRNKEAHDASFANFRVDPDWIAAKEASEKRVGGPLTEGGTAGVQSILMRPADYSPTR